MALPILEPADNELQVTVTIPSHLVPYFELIHREVASQLTYEEYLSAFIVKKGKEYLQQKEDTDAANAMIQANIDTRAALDALSGEIV